MPHALLHRHLLNLALSACLLPAAQADEGMWTFDQVPRAAIQARHGVDLHPAWLARLQGAAVQFGASASFVSAQGLMLTNHHVAEGCLSQLSTPQQDLLKTGFVARSPADERRCPGAVARVLQGIEDVSARLTLATAAAVDDEARNRLRKAEIGRIESTCSLPAQGLHCEVVALYSGALHHLYRYREWDDVRLVWAPEAQAGFYGGDADNFVYPRFALDAALLRVYEHGRPLAPAQVLHLARRPLAEGEPVFVAGHPGRTQRLLTLAQLQVLRELDQPLMIASARSQQALLHAYAARSPEASRQAQDRLFGVENWLKALQGESAALRDPALMADKAAAETRFQAAWAQRGLSGDPWQQIAAATQRYSTRVRELMAVDYGRKTQFAHAGLLVELAHERQLPEGQRLPRFRDAALPDLERQLLAERPLYTELEIALLSGQLALARQWLGPQHPFVSAALGGDTPQAAAERLLRPSRLGDAAVRRQLLAGGLPAIAASTDPLIVLARQVYPMRRALRLFAEEQVDTPIRSAADQLGQARFALYGHSVPPDATGTLRLSFGTVAGYVSNGLRHPWKTTWGGWWDRSDSFDQQPPFDLAPAIAAARGSVPAGTPLDFVLTTDIIGGNSGSPVVNRDGDWVGLIFDGNLEGLGGAFAYQDRTARAVAVHAEAILSALDKVYGAPQLAAELRQR